MQRTAAQVGAPVLEATSLANLDDLLDEAFLRPEFQQLTRDAVRSLMTEMLSALSLPAEPTEEMIRALGEGPARILTGTGPYVAACAAILAHLLTEQGPALSLAPPPDWYVFFAGSGIHATIRRIFLDSLRATVALLAMSHAMFAGQKLAPWLSLALAEKYRDGLYAYLRYCASLGSVHVPESIVPRADRLDLAALQAQIDAREMLRDAVAELAPGDGFSICGVPDDDE